MTPVRGRSAGRRSPALLASLIALVAGCALGLGACSAEPEPQLDAVAAAERYDPVFEEIGVALADAYPTVIWEQKSAERAGLVSRGGDPVRCAYAVRSIRADPSLLEAAGTWDGVGSVLDPVLERHGFTALSEDELDGGWTGASATDPSGARVSLADKGHTDVRLSVGVLDADC